MIRMSYMLVLGTCGGDMAMFKERSKIVLRSNGRKQGEQKYFGDAQLTYRVNRIYGEHGVLLACAN